MEIYFQCKACDLEKTVQLEDLATPAPIICEGCKAELDADQARELAAAIHATAAAMASVRRSFRLEVLLESDDLPHPHGFDEAYTLPEERVASEPSKP